MKITSGYLKLSDEHQDFAWVTYSELQLYNVTAETRKAIENFEKKFPREILGWNTKKELLTVTDIQKINRIKRVIEEYYELSTTDLSSEKSIQSIVRPRQIAIWLSHKLLPDRSLSQLGKVFGGRDHTTVQNSISKIEVLLQSDALLQIECKLHIAKLEKSKITIPIKW